MVNREERQLKPVRDANLVVDVAQVVLDHLLGCAQLGGNFFVLVSLHDQGDDLEFLGGEAVPNARAHQIVLGSFLALIGVLHPAFALAYFANALDQRLTAYIAVNHAVNAIGEIMPGVCAIVSHQHQLGLQLARGFHHNLKVGLHVCTENQYRGVELLDGHHHFFRRFRLSHNA